VAKLKVIKGSYDSDRRRKKIIAAIMIGFSKALKCSNCGAIYFEEEKNCLKCWAEGEEVKLRKITELERRKMLKSWTGKISLRSMDIAELLFCLDKLRELGYEYFKKDSLRSAIEDSRQGMIEKIKETAPFVLGENWERRLKGFYRKTFGKDLMWLNFSELRRVWGFLRRIQKEETTGGKSCCMKK